MTLATRLNRNLRRDRGGNTGVATSESDPALATELAPTVATGVVHTTPFDHQFSQRKKKRKLEATEMATEQAWQRPDTGLATAGGNSEPHGNNLGRKRLIGKRKGMATNMALNDSDRLVQQRIVFCNGNMAFSNIVLANKEDPDDLGSNK